MKCLNCGKEIDKKDKYVLVGTYNLATKPNDEVYFHFSCWEQYFNKCVLNKAKANVQLMQEKAMQLFNNPVMKSMLSQISGSDQVLNMLQTPLEEKQYSIDNYKIDNKNEKKPRKRKKEM